VNQLQPSQGDRNGWTAALIATALLAFGSAAPAPAEDGPLSPAAALKRLRAADGLKIEQVLAEPEIAQPISLNFDERGRLWVVEYRQYPDPAGLTELSRDKFWRAVYDKVPAAPPNHVRGKDRITIHEDTDGDGSYDLHKTFVDGLNIASACAQGRGGVWVLNPPYLLFYPDRDGDDVPDGDPEVHLQGFGLEDTHSVVNSLRWGPDGWLYAAQGSTVGGAVNRPGRDKTPVHSLGQLIWRYHPESRRYEIFAEGGGNAFGVEIDGKGRIYSGHNGGDTRGFHYVQGGYYLKGFQKHGPLSNPFAFGHFPAMKHPNVERFTHTFVIDEDGALPPAFGGKLFGVEPLQGRVVFAEITPDRSSFQTRDLGHAVTSTDPWFRPVDIKAGPDGALYVADFYEGQIAHLRHHEGRIDPSNGRVYRVSAAGAKPSKTPDLGKQTSDGLVTLLVIGNHWARQSALRLLGDRGDPTVLPRLRTTLREGRGQPALEALWALHLSGGFDEPSAMAGLDHADPLVRLWSVRLLADEGRVSPAIASKLATLAGDERNVEVRSQLACSARRLPAAEGLPIVARLLARGEDVEDVHIPLLLWWAIEARCEQDRDAVLNLFRDPAFWKLPMVERHILSRLMQRFAATGSRKDGLTCARLLELAPGRPERDRLLQGFELASKGRSLAALPGELVDALAKAGGGSLMLDVRSGRQGAIAEALKVIADEQADRPRRLALVEVVGEVKLPGSLPTLLSLVDRPRDQELRIAAMDALRSFDDPAIAATVLARYRELPVDVRAAAQTLLAGRQGPALAFVMAVDRGEIDPATLPPEVVRSLTLHRDPRIVALVAKHWGVVEGAASEELGKEVERLERIARTGAGDRSQGKVLFGTACAKCHALFGQGGQVGPDLTPYQRNDVPALLLNIINPDAEIREGYERMQVATKDGRVVDGFLVENDPRVVVLRGADGHDVTLPRDEIEEMQAVRKSLMPEGLLKGLGDQDVRDLLSYLRSAQPLNE